MANIAVKLVGIGIRRKETGRHDMISVKIAIEIEPALAVQALTPLNPNRSHEEPKAKGTHTLMPNPAPTGPSYSV